MRLDPVFMSWLVRFPSGEQMLQAKGWLAENLRDDLTIPYLVRAHPNGAPAQSVEQHRQGDYFTEVLLDPGRSEEPASFRLIFHRRPDAGRFWKDFMVRLFQMVRERYPGATAVLDYRGDQAPAETAETPD